jgi:ceramide glucosyltransferase
MLAYLILIIAAIGTLSSTVFLVLALLGRARYHPDMRAQQHEDERLVAGHGGNPPGVSVLKPVHGMEPRLRENLESFFRQQYPHYELVFCARTRDDSALLLVDELAAQYPQVKINVLTCGEPTFPNAKVYSLTRMIEAAQHDILVISDSDVEVAPEYVREVSASLLDPATGVVTCLYRGLPAGGLWSRLEALGMSVEMTSGVLIANMLEGMKFALGPTMATRKDVITKIGGAAQLGDYCADDFVLGNLADAAGYKNKLSPHAIDHIVVNRDWAASWAHHVRWMKSTRFSRPKGHLGTGLTFAMPFGVLGLIGGLLAGNPWLGVGFVAWAVLNRMLQSVAIGWGVVKDPRALRDCWLYPLRDLLGFFVWIASYGDNLIDWRGEKYRLAWGGKMEKADR